MLEEAHELAEASSAKDIAFEAADLLYFSLVKCLSNGVVLVDIEQNLDLKSKRISRRKGDAKPAYSAALNFADNQDHIAISKGSPAEESKDVDASTGGDQGGPIQLGERISMRRLYTARDDASTISQALQRPSQSMDEKIKNAVIPIIQEVKSKGDSALLHFTRKFDRAESLQTPTLQSPFPEQLMKLSSETIQAIDLSFDNIRRFHEAQKEEVPLKIDTMPGVTCSRFSRPIEKVGLYVPGGTAVLPSTAMMLGVPAMVAGCRQIVIASPPRPDGSVSPEIVYVAHKVGAESILLAGGAQAVAALAYGTETVPKVDKILGPGNQYVTAAKMFVSTDMNARVSIDMPAGPSELLVIADCTANPAFVASDLLSQAEHGVDSQVILLAVDLTEKQLGDIEEELDKQAKLLPRLNIIRESIKRSVTLVTRTIDEAIDLSNEYAPEHLSLQINEAENAVEKIQQAGSIFIGAWTPESVGDYSAGVNHSLREFSDLRSFSIVINKIVSHMRIC